LKKNLTRPWTGKAEGPTNEKKKIAHEDRKTKKQILHELENADWEQQLKEYNANQQIQE
jgi:hypothetical protein